MTEENNTPVNEFTTEGYLTMMFPTKFINGTADITTNKNKIEVGWKKYIKHLIN